MIILEGIILSKAYALCGLMLKFNMKQKPKNLKGIKSLFNTVEGANEAFDVLFERFKDKTILLYWNSMSAISRDELVNKLINSGKKVNVFELSSKSANPNHELFGREYLILAK